MKFKQEVEDTLHGKIVWAIAGTFECSLELEPDAMEGNTNSRLRFKEECPKELIVELGEFTSEEGRIFKVLPRSDFFFGASDKVGERSYFLFRAITEEIEK